MLKHHPDKKAASGNINDDSFFKCIQKGIFKWRNFVAYEILSDTTKRRQYDSVDPRISDALPGSKEGLGHKFYSVYDPIFEREGRYSTM